MLKKPRFLPARGENRCLQLTDSARAGWGPRTHDGSYYALFYYWTV